MVVEHRTLTRLGATVGEVEAFGNLDGRHASGVQSHRGLLAAAFDPGRLKSDDVVQGALGARHLAVGQTAVGTLQLLETGDALQHFLARYTLARQGFPVSHGVLLISRSEHCARGLPLCPGSALQQSVPPEKYGR